MSQKVSCNSIAIIAAIARTQDYSKINV